MQTTSKDAKMFNGTTIFAEAIVQLTHDDLAEVIKRSGVKSFDGKMQDALCEHVAGELGIRNTHGVVVCHVCPDPHTELLTWNVEAVYVRNFTDLNFSA